jgi:hypothetical protein
VPSPPSVSAVIAMPFANIAEVSALSGRCTLVKVIASPSRSMLSCST